MFDEGVTYTRSQISARIGGSIQSFLPTVGNEVVCACLTTRLNPDAPKVILAGNGPTIAANAERLGRQRVPVAAFIKRAPNAWEYVGDWRPLRASTDYKEIATYASRAGRADVKVIVFMEPAR